MMKARLDSEYHMAWSDILQQKAQTLTLSKNISLWRLTNLNIFLYIILDQNIFNIAGYICKRWYKE